MEDEELTKKQTFLRENVLEKGYDAESFMVFLQAKKGDAGLDLNLWSMDELVKTVEEFVKDKEPDKEEAEKQKIKSAEVEPDNNIEENNFNNNEEEEVYDLDKFNQDHPFEPTSFVKDEFAKCKISETTPISTKEKVKVSILFPEKVEGGIFSKSYVSYLVQTEPFGFKNRKRYSDFVWLRKALSHMYSNCVIPPLCKKNYGDRFSEALTSKRMRSIEKFIAGILIHPLMRNCQILYDFLSINKEEEYFKIKSGYGKITGPTQVKEIKTLNGEIKTAINKEKEMYFCNIKDNSSYMEELLQKVTKSYKSIMNLMQQVSEKMKELSDLWHLVFTKSSKYYDNYNTSETYNIMTSIMSDWSESYKKQINILNLSIREYFRYIKNEYGYMKRMSTRVDANKGLYAKSFEKLYTTKESLFKQQDLTLWGLEKKDLENKLVFLKNKDLAFEKMLPKQTKKVNEFKYFYGSHLNSLIDEFERLRGINAVRHKSQITSFIRQICDALTEFHVSLADRLTQYDDSGTIEVKNLNSQARVDNREKDSL